MKLSPPPPLSPRNKSELPRNEAGQSLSPLAVPVGLPPVWVLLADHVQDVAPLEGDAQLVAGDVEVVVRGVGEVCSVVELKLLDVETRDIASVWDVSDISISIVLHRIIS